MLIENPDALKVWLTKHLSSICDADPHALSKYVVALLKRDKSVDNLKVSMEGQMEVFLQDNTSSFVEDLFKTLESKDYITNNASEAQNDDPEHEASRQKSPEEPEGEKQPPDSTTPVRGDDSSRHSRERTRTGDDLRSHLSRRRHSPHRKGRKVSQERGHRYGGRRSRSRSRSRSPIYSRRHGKTSRSVSPPAYLRKSPTRGSTPTKDEENNPYIAPKKQRCRDYDEKGYCLQGDQCKFDHGNDAVVLEDTVGGIPAYTPASMSSSIYADPYIPSTTTVPLPPLHLPPPGFANGSSSRKRPFEDDSNIPAKASAFSRLGNRGRGRGSYRGRGGGGGGAGFRGRGRSKQLVIRNIPPNLNNIAHLNNHFAKYGSLVNIQVQFEGNPASALVTFSTFEEAEAAFSSSEAVLGNRFIKLFYHHENPKPGQKEEKSPEKPKTEEEKTALNEKKTEEKAAAIAEIKKNQEMLEAKAKQRKELEEKRKESLKKMTEIRKSKQEILEKLIEQQKKLISKIETRKATMKPEEKESLMSLLKNVTESVSKAREDLKKVMQVAALKKTPVEIQKELLDAELELFQAQNDGSEETLNLQKKVEQLRFEASKAGLTSSVRGGIRGRGTVFRGGRRGFFQPRGMRGGRGGRIARGAYVATSIDRRPSKIIASGFDEDEKDSLIEHFKGFGEIVEVKEEDNGDLGFQFKTRREAEAAMKNGKTFGERTLSLHWPVGTVADVTPELLDSSSQSSHHAVEDDYTPLDPTYLPPGIDEDIEIRKKKDDDDEVNQLLYDDDDEDELHEDEGDEELDDEDEEDDEKSWKR